MNLAGPRDGGELTPLAECRVVVLCAEPRLRQLLSYWLAIATPDLTVASNGREAAALLADVLFNKALVSRTIVEGALHAVGAVSPC